jgi:HD-GYP domain-containing protein (c-di-GMP phosphodiesterase class II)
MRDIDILARYGGEEFAVVCSHIKEEGVLALCERVRESFARYTFKKGGKSARMTISIGVSSNSDPRVATPSVLVRYADEALYEAKHRGKNNVCHWREKQSMTKLLDKDSQEKIEYYQNRFLGFTHEIIDKFLEYSRSIVEDIEKKDRRTAQHSSKVTSYSMALARALHFSDAEINTIQLAGMLHDIGKAGIDPKILYKKGEYKPKEFRVMKLHPLFSVKMIEPLNFLDQEMQVILQHHERFDGKGYPTGRKGLDINRGARVLSLCDSYDAMTAGRCYKKKISPKEACRAIDESSGKQFDPEMAKVFIRMVEKKAL